MSLKIRGKKKGKLQSQSEYSGEKMSSLMADTAGLHRGVHCKAAVEAGQETCRMGCRQWPTAVALRSHGLGKLLL